MLGCGLIIRWSEDFYRKMSPRRNFDGINSPWGTKSYRYKSGGETFPGSEVVRETGTVSKHVGL